MISVLVNVSGWIHNQLTYLIKSRIVTKCPISTNYKLTIFNKKKNNYKVGQVLYSSCRACGCNECIIL